MQVINQQSGPGQGQAADRARAAQGTPLNEGRRSWLAHMRGDARASAAELLQAWLADFQAAGVRHTPQSFTALVNVRLFLDFPSVPMFLGP